MRIHGQDGLICPACYANGDKVDGEVVGYCDKLHSEQRRQAKKKKWSNEAYRLLCMFSVRAPWRAESNEAVAALVD